MPFLEEPERRPGSLFQPALSAYQPIAIRWTENLFSVKDYLVQKKGVASYQIDELFKSVGLPKNLDIEWGTRPLSKIHVLLCLELGRLATRPPRVT